MTETVGSDGDGENVEHPAPAGAMRMFPRASGFPRPDSRLRGNDVGGVDGLARGIRRRMHDYGG